LNDHLAGTQIAVQVLEAMCEQHDDQRFCELLNVLLPEVQADDRTLRGIAEKIGPVLARSNKPTAD
jgi:acetone carboxylase gamma subunit